MVTPTALELVCRASASSPSFCSQIFSELGEKGGVSEANFKSEVAEFRGLSLVQVEAEVNASLRAARFA